MSDERLPEDETPGSGPETILKGDDDPEKNVADVVQDEIEAPDRKKSDDDGV